MRCRYADLHQQTPSPPPESFLPTYKPSHVDPECSCSMISAGEDRLTAAAQRGNAMVAAFDDGLLTFEEMDPVAIPNKLQYTAISHIRSQGLGNTESSSLPTCQVQRLQQYVNQLYANQQPNQFWIDTICLPNDLKLRRESVKNIHHIFRHANSSLVVVRSLTSLSASSSNSDNLESMRRSSWFGRLWTLQEGADTPRLLFQFANCAMDLDQLLGDDLQTPSQLLEQVYQLTRDVKSADLHRLRDAVKFHGHAHELEMTLLAIIRLCYIGLVPRFETIASRDEKETASRLKVLLESIYSLQYGPKSAICSGSTETCERLSKIFYEATKGSWKPCLENV
ncbi:hypothetical protein BP5796_09320 [Coleophoma crateriformis]|uniref:Heterokaryon incompatibility domain-containing protein n=1 Tax=Coleophoma crateriformis TaxID=565419 RepID=A0A3D8R3M8_9HELO|nr:hypothetical protein BP5796_09320 [Coleophoma crateriformis]